MLVFKEPILINLAVLKPTEEQNFPRREKVEALLFGMVVKPGADSKRQIVSSDIFHLKDCLSLR